MKYYAWLSNGSGGCDYTVGCGERLEELKAGTMEEARVALEVIIKDHGGDHVFDPDDERSLAMIRILEVSTVAEIDMQQRWEAIRETKEAEKRAEREKHERAELERLKAKFGG